MVDTSIIIGPSPEKWKNLKGYHKADTVCTDEPNLCIHMKPLPPS